MKESGRQGFSLVGLAAVTVAVTLLALALVPAISHSVMSASLVAVGCRGRDIYVAITGANSEREPLGLPPVWPADKGFYTNAVAGDISSVAFTNSTDYFRNLYDETHIGTERWNPVVAGFDYSKLAGNGVPRCKGGRLAPSSNIWTVAKNIREDAPDVLPVLITRNVDAKSLASAVSLCDMNRHLRFDGTWKYPNEKCGLVIIRKGGSIFKARLRNGMSFQNVYSGQTFNVTRDGRGLNVLFPLAYLTPSQMVVPGTAEEEMGHSSIWETARRELSALYPAGAAVGVVYLLFAFVYRHSRGVRESLPRYPKPCVALAFAHCFAVIFWLGCIWGPLVHAGDFRGSYLLLALLSQLIGIIICVVGNMGDRVEQLRGMKWIVSVPLFVGGMLLVLILWMIIIL